MSSEKHELTTKSGMRLDECISWLQKAIRRGKEEEALWVAEELFQSGFQRYLLYRLWIIAYEDIGVAKPSIVHLASVTYQTWLLHKKEKGNDWARSGENRVFNGMLIIQMCRAPKCRMADDATQYILSRKEAGWTPKMNEAAVLDEHCKRGKEMKRKYLHWVEIGSKCANLLGQDFTCGPTYKAEAEEMWRKKGEKLGEEPPPIDPEVMELGLK